MSRIDTLHINNFKFFDIQKPIKLDGKHLLLYGENGSGKSSIYWSLYTLFEASIKIDKADIQKYFEDAETNNESLVNIYATTVRDVGGMEHYNSFVETQSTDTPAKKYTISFKDQSISGLQEAIEINQSSDFINYKVLYKLQDFWNGKPMDLANIFLGYIMPYVKFPAAVINRNGAEVAKTNAFDMWQEIVYGPGYTRNHKGNKILVYKNSDDFIKFQQFVSRFNSGFRNLIDFININAPKLLLKLGYDIGFQLEYIDASFEKKDVVYTPKLFSIGFKITSYLGKKVNVHRPQSFLNEAKMTAISLAIRLTVLQQRVNKEAGDIMKFIVFDDVMISLDMNNRDKLMDFLLDKENNLINDYQLLFLTHDKNLYHFAINKIKQLDSPANWVFKEMYVGADVNLKKEYPILIDSALDNIEKAEKYFKARDYTSCALYIRKELEKLVIERLPLEYTKAIENQYHNLAHLWKLCIERYGKLDHLLSEDIKNSFDQTKLMLLNPQAHHNLSLPVYTLELEKAFKLIDDITKTCPIPEAKILISKGMILQFKHPTQDYSMTFEFLNDFYIDGLSGVNSTVIPKCRILTWQYNQNEYWDISTNNVVVLSKPIEHSLKQIKETLTGGIRVPLGITDDIFYQNTSILNSIWTLEEILKKSGASLN